MGKTLSTSFGLAQCRDSLLGVRFPGSRHSQNAKIFSRRVSSDHAPQLGIYSPSYLSNPLPIKTAALRKTCAPDIEMGEQAAGFIYPHRGHRLRA